MRRHAPERAERGPVEDELVEITSMANKWAAQ
jgi:hypothetical protein